MTDFVQNILGYSSSIKCIHIQNGGKEWVIPLKRISMGLEIYQATSLKGKLLKVLIRSGFYNFRFGNVRICTMNCGLSDVLDRLIKQTFGIEEYYFSSYVGDQRIEENQKLVLQIFDDEKIFGYAKLSTNKGIYDLFSNERNILGQLESANADIPKCLALGELESNIFYYIQSTAKTNDSKIVTKFTDAHQAVLKEWHSKYKTLLPFCETLLGRRYEYLYKVLEYDAPNLLQGLKLCKSLFMQNGVNCSFSHGDFTPWNMFSNSGRLFIFDFEYAAFNRIQFYDYIHFYLQVELLCNNIKMDNIDKFYNNFLKTAVKCWKCSEKEFIASMLFYLYDQFAFQYRRRDDRFEHTDRGFILWQKIVMLIVDNNCGIG